MEVKLFFVGFDKPMQHKIHEQSEMLNTKYNLVTLANKLWLNQNCDAKTSFPTRFQTQPFFSYFPERNKAYSASFTHRKSCRKKMFDSYCNKSGHIKAQCHKKFLYTKKSKATGVNATRVKVASRRNFSVN